MYRKFFTISFRLCFFVFCITTSVLVFLSFNLVNIQWNEDPISLWSADYFHASKIIKHFYGKTNDPYQFSVIQSNEQQNILRKDHIRQHAFLLNSLSRVHVYEFGIEWSLNDVCNKLNLKNYEDNYLDLMIHKMNPCLIASVLDCFWEGSELLGPSVPITITSRFNQSSYTWKNIDPLQILENLISAKFDPSLKYVYEFINSSGIDHGYLSRPCLEASHSKCGNRSQAFSRNIFNKGCPSFAPNIVHWTPGDLFGNITHSTSGDILSANSLRAVFFIKSPLNFYRHLKFNYIVDGIDWSPESAEKIIRAFYLKFKLIIDEYNSMKDHDTFDLLCKAYLDSNYKSYSKTHLFAFVAFIMLSALFVSIRFRVLKDWHFVSCLISTSLLNFASVIAGFGLLVLFNIAYQWILLEVGVALIVMSFLPHYVYLAKSYFICSAFFSTDMAYVFLSLVFPVIAMSSTFMFSLPLIWNLNYFLSSLWGISAMVLLFTFPSVIYLSSLWLSELLTSQTVITSITRLSRFPEDNTLQFKNEERRVREVSNNELEHEESHEVEDNSLGSDGRQSSSDQHSSLISRFLLRLFGSQYLILSAALALLIGSSMVLSCSSLAFGISIRDVFHKESSQSKYFQVWLEQFGDSNLDLIIGDLDKSIPLDYSLPETQRLLVQMDSAIRDLPHVSLFPGILSGSWLIRFRDWLLEHEDVDVDLPPPFYVDASNFSSALSTRGQIAFKLALFQMNGKNPLRGRGTVTHNIVRGDGTIDVKNFYSYLTAWANLDLVGYPAIDAGFVPAPWFYELVPYDSTQHFRQSEIPLVSVFHYQMRKFDSNGQQILFIDNLLNFVKKYRSLGLPVVPYGFSISFWSQFIDIKLYSFVCLIAPLLVGCAYLFILLRSLQKLMYLVLVHLFYAVMFFGLLSVCQLTVSPIIIYICVFVNCLFTPFYLRLFTEAFYKCVCYKTAFAVLTDCFFDQAFTIIISLIPLIYSEFPIVTSIAWVLAIGVVSYICCWLLLTPIILTLANSSFCFSSPRSNSHRRGTINSQKHTVSEVTTVDPFPLQLDVISFSKSPAKITNKKQYRRKHSRIPPTLRSSSRYASNTSRYPQLINCESFRESFTRGNREHSIERSCTHHDDEVLSNFYPNRTSSDSFCFRSPSEYANSLRSE